MQLDIKGSDVKPDPFNHGNHIIESSPIAGYEEESILSDLLKRYWGLVPSRLFKIDRNTAYSYVYIVEFDNREFIFSKSRVNNVETQELHDTCAEFGLKNELPIFTAITTTSGKKYHNDGSNIWTLNHRIKGTHFDGSLKALENSAINLAKFHRCFREFPSIESVKRIKKDVYPFDWTELEYLLRACRKKESEYNDIIETLYDKIQECKPLERGLEALQDYQIGHYDWHPHNLLFVDDRVVGILDFDLLHFGSRTYDVAMSMHKFSRVFGELTQAKQDVGNNLSNRCSAFLEAYQAEYPLPGKEIDSITSCIYEGVRRKTHYIIDRYINGGIDASLFDLEKQYVQLMEIEYIH